MKKIETIWREMLFQAIEKGHRQFRQKDLAFQFGFSTSTVFQALKTPRRMGEVRVTGRSFILEDPEKLLFHWASVRNLEKDLLLKAKINLPVAEIEGEMPPEVVFAGFRAACEILQDSPADYDQIYVYTDSAEPIVQRFHLLQPLPKKQESANLFLLKADKFLANYGQMTTLAQTFVDLWNLPVWYAREFTKALKEKIDGLLS